MTCTDVYDGGSNLTGLLTSLDFTYSMSSGFSASATLENPSCELSINSVFGSCVPVYATLEAQAKGLTEVISEANLTNCFSANADTKWIAGIVSAFGEAQDGVSDKVDISIKSYFERLNQVPMTSYQFSSTSVNALQQILDYFAGIPSDLYSYSVVANPIWGAIDGGNVMDAIKTVAQLSMSSAYIQVGGILEIQQWKDHNSPIELTLPRELIGPINKRSSDLIPRLGVAVRGTTLDVQGCGTRTVSDSRLATTEGGYSGDPGPVTNVALSGVDTQQMKSILANLNAQREALEDAKIIHGLGVTIEKVKAEDGSIEFKITKVGANFFSKTPTQIRAAIAAAWKKDPKGRRDNKQAWKNLNAQIAALKKDQMNLQRKMSSIFKGDQAEYFPAGAEGGPADGPGSKRASSVDVRPTDTTNTQLETYVFNNSVQIPCGTSLEQMDNSLCNSRDVLFRMGVRRHQEILMDNNTFNIELNGFIPCLRLNQVIAFETPGTADCPPRFIKGLVREIKGGYNPQEGVKMSLVVADLTVLGQTQYSSTNLIDWQCGGGENAVIGNPWEASALSIESSATIQDNSINLFGMPGTTLVFAYLNQFLQAGQTYTLSFRYQSLFGSTPITFDNTAGSGAILPGPVGIYTETFVAATATPQFKWSLVNPVVRSSWRIYDIQLTREVIA